MLNWHVPTTMTELRAFLGLTGYYRKFVRNYGVMTKPLTAILRLKQFVWNSADQSAFDDLKVAIVAEPPELVHFWRCSSSTRH